MAAPADLDELFDRTIRAVVEAHVPATATIATTEMTDTTAASSRGGTE
jgi:hypothetical protein